MKRRPRTIYLEPRMSRTDLVMEIIRQVCAEEYLSEAERMEAVRAAYNFDLPLDEQLPARDGVSA